METHTVVFKGGPHDGATTTVDINPRRFTWPVRENGVLLGYYRSDTGEVFRGMLVAEWRDA